LLTGSIGEDHACKMLGQGSRGLAVPVDGEDFGGLLLGFVGSLGPVAVDADES
jgi:hypothetical protein